MERDVNQTGSPRKQQPLAWLWKLDIEEVAYRLLSDHQFGNHVIPGTTKRFEFGESSWPEVATVYNNDGFELWIGTGHEWHTNMTRTDARRLARFILWEWWIKGEWFGLKRWAWYQLLHRRVAKTQQMAAFFLKASRAPETK